MDEVNRVEDPLRSFPTAFTDKPHGPDNRLKTKGGRPSNQKLETTDPCLFSGNVKLKAIRKCFTGITRAIHTDGGIGPCGKGIEGDGNGIGALKRVGAGLDTPAQPAIHPTTSPTAGERIPATMLAET